MRAEYALTQHSEELVSRAQAGDKEAFGALVAEYGPDVFRVCMIITTERSLAEDAAQNTWHKVWRRLTGLREVASLRPWLFKVAANEARQLVRRRRRDTAGSLDTAADLAAGGDPYEHERLRAALRRLEPAERELLAARYVLGMNSDEIGQQLGLSPAGVRSRLKRTRDRLQKELRDEV